MINLIKRLFCKHELYLPEYFGMSVVGMRCPKCQKKKYIQWKEFNEWVDFFQSEEEEEKQ